MQAQDFAQVCELFDAARVLDPAAREALLNEIAAKAPSMRSSVESLLASDEAATREAFLEGPSPLHLGAPWNDRPAGDALIGGRIGPYHIQRLIATGGMGDVYLAVRVSHYDQQVAIKVIRRGTDHPDLLRRFHTERQILAHLQHPHIAHLLDGGNTPDDLPYLVMEYIDGQPIDLYCDSRELSSIERAKLLERVCLAVQFAHEHWVIHRDLKPSNVLITKDGTPKITDFGLAKQLGLEQDHTLSGSVLGTPGYMAPEQANRNFGNVGPAADVYALGAILYRLLTGRAPFRAETPLDTVMQLVSEEPVAPSRLHPRLPRDLETICLKCLEKEPAKRYDTVRQLADDLGRFVRAEPTKARPVGFGGRLFRWCRRSPKVAALAACLSLTLVGGIGCITYLWQLAEHREETARRETVEVGKQRERAEANFRRALSIIDKYLNRVSRSELLRAEGLEPVRRELLQLALSEYEDLLKERAFDPDAQDELARAYYRLAYFHRHVEPDSTAAMAAIQKAISLWEPLVDSGELFEARLGAAHEVYGNLQSGTREGLAAHQRSLAIREKLFKRNRNDVGVRSNLAFSYDSLAKTHANLGNDDQSLEFWNHAARLREELLAEQPEFFDNQMLLAGIYRSLAHFHRQRGNLPDAIVSLRRGCEHWAQLVQRHPANDLLQSERGAPRELAIALSELGELQADSRALADAMQSLSQARTIQERLVEHDARRRPIVTILHGELARTYDRLAAAEMHSENWPAAIAFLRQATEILEKLVAVNSNAESSQSLVDNLSRTALVYERWGKHDEATAARTRVRELQASSSSQHRE